MSNKKRKKTLCGLNIISWVWRICEQWKKKKHCALKKTCSKFKNNTKETINIKVIYLFNKLLNMKPDNCYGNCCKTGISRVRVVWCSFTKTGKERGREGEKKLAIRGRKNKMVIKGNNNPIFWFVFSYLLSLIKGILLKY